MSLVNVRNCIRFYQTAEELNASTLMNYCAEIIASHWVSGGEGVGKAPSLEVRRPGCETESLAGYLSGACFLALSN